MKKESNIENKISSSVFDIKIYNYPVDVKYWGFKLGNKKVKIPRFRHKSFDFPFALLIRIQGNLTSSWSRLNFSRWKNSTK